MLVVSFNYCNGRLSVGDMVIEPYGRVTNEEVYFSYKKVNNNDIAVVKFFEYTYEQINDKNVFRMLDHTPFNVNTIISADCLVDAHDVLNNRASNLSYKLCSQVLASMRKLINIYDTINYLPIDILISMHEDNYYIENTNKNCSFFCDEAIIVLKFGSTDTGVKYYNKMFYIYDIPVPHIVMTSDKKMISYMKVMLCVYANVYRFISN